MELSQLIVQIFDTCIFEPPFGGLRTTYNVHLGLIGKRVVDFPLLLNETFLLGVTVEALQAKIDRKLAISLQRGHFDQTFQVEGDVPPIIFGRFVRPMNALQLCHRQFSHKDIFTQRNFVADFLQAKCDFRRKTAVLHF